MLFRLPLALRQRLLEAEQNLDIEETTEVIAQIHNLTPDIAASLQKMAEGYQFEQMLKLTEAAMLDGEATHDPSPET